MARYLRLIVADSVMRYLAFHCCYSSLGGCSNLKTKGLSLSGSLVFDCPPYSVPVDKLLAGGASVNLTGADGVGTGPGVGVSATVSILLIVSPCGCGADSFRGKPAGFASGCDACFGSGVAAGADVVTAPLVGSNSRVIFNSSLLWV